MAAHMLYAPSICQSLEGFSKHYPIGKLSVFTEAVLRGSARLSNMHLGALRTGDLVYHACALVHGYRVLEMD